MKNSIKIIIFSSLILCIIIVSGLFIKRYLTVTTDTYLSELTKVEKCIIDNQWDEAANLLNKLDSNWNETKTKWGLFTDHKEIDNISISLKSTMSYVKTRNIPLSMASLKTLEHYLSHIPDMEELSLENIF